MKMKDLCKEERPREKMLALGSKAMSNGELIAILLRTGNKGESALDLAQRLLSENNGKLTRLTDIPVSKLCSFKGMGQNKAASLVAAFELGRRFMTECTIDSNAVITGSRTAYEMLLPHFKGLDHEECWIVFLDSANRVISRDMMSSGGSNSTVIDNKMIIKMALEKHASGLILAHNHPFGSSRPGKADIRQTQALKEVAGAFDISLLDHIVISQDGYYSFADEESYFL